MQGKKRYIGVVTAALLMGGSVAYAQAIPNQPAPVQYIIAPEAPGPGQLVNIEVQGIGGFLGDSTITWQQDGKTVSSGTGDASFSFTTGSLGTQTHVRLIIDSTTNGTITHDFYFYPSLLNLVWEAQTTVPSLYLGKPLYSAGSSVRVVAFPLVKSGGAFIPASKLSYQWSVNSTPLTTQSGLGASTITVQGDQIQSGEDVSVDAYYGQTKVAHADLTIPAAQPQVIMYIEDPLRGELLDKAVPSGTSLDQKEITLHAEPYYFAKESAARGALQYSWTLNGQEASGPDSAQGLLTLRQTGTGAGAAQVEVSVQNTQSSQYVQQASAGLEFIFGQQTGSALSSFFGL